jgi:Holliday junction DNA helicase RuvA
VHAALVGLGWGARDADAALTAVAEEFGEDADSTEVAVLLRAALQSMSKAVGAR